MINKKILEQLLSIDKKVIEQLDEFYGVSTDTRTLTSNEIFIALDGENFKGKVFLKEACTKGARIIVYKLSDLSSKEYEEIQKINPNCILHGVQNTLVFYQNLAKEHAKQWREKDSKRRIIGITGSNGKTTHKEMLFHILNNVFPQKVLSTEKNFNNHIGVPKTLLNLTDDHDLAIVEMGINHKGEMDILCDIAAPNAGIITNIGKAHLEFFLTQENIFNQKRILFDQVMKNTKGVGEFVLNGDDYYLSQIEGGERTVFYKESSSNLNKKNSYFNYNYSYPTIEIFHDNGSWKLKSKNLVGVHNFLNLMGTFLMAVQLFPKKVNKFISAAETFIPRLNRSLWVEEGDKKFFLDAYNANPSSMVVALEGILEYYKKEQIDPSKQVYLLGDMNELGTEAEEGHQEVGAKLKEIGALHVIFIGRYARFYAMGYGQSCLIVQNKEEFVSKYWHDTKQKFQYFFIKGSRGLQLETLVES